MVVVAVVPHFPHHCCVAATMMRVAAGWLLVVVPRQTHCPPPYLTSEDLSLRLKSLALPHAHPLHAQLHHSRECAPLALVCHFRMRRPKRLPRSATNQWDALQVEKVAGPQTRPGRPLAAVCLAR